MAKEKITKKRLILLDSHAIIHRAYHALPDFMSSKGEPTGALYGLSTMLMKIITDLKPDYIVAAYDLPQKTFRHEAYDAYKAGRMKADDDLVTQIKSSRTIFEAFNIPMYDAPGFEADDVLGTIVENMKKDKEIDIIIASGDMDTLQLVDDDKVQVFTLKKGINDTILYNEDLVVARYGFKPKLLVDYKGLRGDPSDNIIGIKGIGEKTATTLIQTFGTIEEIYKKLKKDKAAFKKAGITDRIITLLEEGEDEALFSKTLATIRRDAAIAFQLPEKTFRDTIDVPKIETLFREYEFRSLIARVGTIFNVAITPEEKTVIPEEQVDQKLFNETAIALWLLNSELTNITLADMLAYAHVETFDTARAKILEDIKTNDLSYVYEQIELPIIPIVDGIYETGIEVDKAYLEKLSKTYHKELDSLEAKIWKHAGREFNINSPKQLGDILFDELAINEGTGTKLKKTAGGARSTRESELVKLRDAHPIVADILLHRELQKLLSTYIDTLPLLISDDKRLHAKFIQAGTTTGRFASQDPNLQNIPTRTELGRNIRNAFVAKKGSVLLAFDYSQIELRIAALLSQDPFMIKVFQEDKDVHAAVASKVFGVPEDKVDNEMRRRAKVINFGILYGMGVTALRENLGTDRKTAQEFYDNYFAQFPTIRDYLDTVKADAYKYGYTKTLFGRKRYFPGLKSKMPFVRAMAERMAINAPIQGTATADIVKLAIRDIQAKLEENNITDKVLLVLQVHDELVYEVDTSVVPLAKQIIGKAMQDIIPPSFLKNLKSVPIEVHSKEGAHWGELK
jgi:DNA polymerase-1